MAFYYLLNAKAAKGLYANPLPLGHDPRFGCSAHIFFAYTVGQFDDPQPTGDHIQNAQIGDDAVDYGLAGQRQGAITQHLGFAVL